jgi:DNA-binding transcriptional LysR family regulator
VIETYTKFEQNVLMAGMTLDQLQIFLAVAECLHFTRAGEVLYLSQSAVSAAIQSLEDEYGVKLFHRIGRHIEITEAGKLLQQQAPKIIEQVTLAQQGLRELNNLHKGVLKLGASLRIGNYWLPDFISRFKYQYPSIQVHCTLGNTELISAGTVQGIFDIGLVEGKIKPASANVLAHQIVGSDMPPARTTRSLNRRSWKISSLV